MITFAGNGFFANIKAQPAIKRALCPQFLKINPQLDCFFFSEKVEDKIYKYALCAYKICRYKFGEFILITGIN